MVWPVRVHVKTSANGYTLRVQDYKDVDFVTGAKTVTQLEVYYKTKRAVRAALSKRGLERVLFKYMQHMNTKYDSCYEYTDIGVFVNNKYITGCDSTYIQEMYTSNMKQRTAKAVRGL